MNKRNLQKQRIMRFFIDAAKEIIKTEGIKNITARRVGETAGYSYATIYNYFKDMNTLLTYCAFDFLEDCYEHVITFKDDKWDCKEQLIIYNIEFFKYFAENPEIFKLVYLEDLGKIPEELSKRPSISRLILDNLNESSKKGYLQKNSIDLLLELMGASIHGKLLFYLNRPNENQDLDFVLQVIEKEIEFLLNNNEVKNYE
ncbi:TetR/AcrR family transcriptional regulator [Alkaliphilus serpentinus]|nr:TetR/AcrR family transcriptional regulator [Alkaliphilus serpentinus]